MPEEKAKIEYPCIWEYKVFGIDEAAIRTVAAGILEDRTYDIKFSKHSVSGKYVSMSVTTFVEDEASRNRIFKAFKEHVAVKYVL